MPYPYIGSACSHPFRILPRLRINVIDIFRFVCRFRPTQLSVMFSRVRVQLMESFCSVTDGKGPVDDGYRSLCDHVPDSGRVTPRGLDTWRCTGGGGGSRERSWKEE